MAYPEDVLTRGEQLVLHRHPHWKLLVPPVLALVGVAGVTGFLAALVREQPWAGAAWTALAVAAAGLVLWWTAGPVLRWRCTHFALTDRRVLIREGLFTRTGTDIPMTRINSVQFRYGIMDRMLGTGTLIIESAGDEPLELADVPQVRRVHELLYNEVSDAAGPRPDQQADVGEPPARSHRGRRG